jgi:hypothetical protein
MVIKYLLITNAPNKCLPVRERYCHAPKNAIFVTVLQRSQIRQNRKEQNRKQ